MNNSFAICIDPKTFTPYRVQIFPHALRSWSHVLLHLISLFKLFCLAITFISFAMASLLESVAQFSLRAREFRLSEDSLRKLKRAGLDTFGILAYAHGQPGQQIDDDKFEQ